MEEYDTWQHLNKKVHDENDVEKSERHIIFGQWIVKELLPSTAEPARGRVLDVAGGKGHLSSVLAESGVHCALIDPHAVAGRALHKVEVPEGVGEQDVDDTRCSDNDPVLVLCQTLEHVLKTSPLLVDNCAAIVGLHPDEATEPIIDTALARGVPFAVLPCCVYPTINKHRKSLCGYGVRKYGAFIEYLMEKDPRMRSARLPFVGRNAVLFMTAHDFQRPREKMPRPNYTPCYVAAIEGDLSLLQELRREGHPWNVQICWAGARGGHVNILEWAVLNGCLWDWQLVIGGARKGNHEHVVQWALDEGAIFEKAEA